MRAHSPRGTPHLPTLCDSSSMNTARPLSKPRHSSAKAFSYISFDGCGSFPKAPKIDPRWFACPSRSSTCAPCRSPRSAWRTSVFPEPVGPPTIVIGRSHALPRVHRPVPEALVAALKRVHRQRRLRKEVRAMLSLRMPPRKQ